MDPFNRILSAAPRLRRMIVVLALGVSSIPVPVLASNTSASMPVTIETSKGFGPVHGVFSASGAFVDSGTLDVLARNVSASGAPDFGVSHLSLLLTGSQGTIVLKTQIVETFTADPLVLSNDGTWSIVDGTGVYATLRGSGSVTGTADENIDVISRTFEGTVRFH